ncbi:MAG: hypothetical protein C0403_07370 [Desulfobacterium sp.]|nr:hypothetical protein [Desulfobacterium sp.]
MTGFRRFHIAGSVRDFKKNIRCITEIRPGIIADNPLFNFMRTWNCFVGFQMFGYREQIHQEAG